MEIMTFGGGVRQLECARILGSLPRGGRILLLPIPTTKDNEYIFGTDIRLAEIESMTEDDSLLVGYRLPGGLNIRGRRLDVSLDGEFQGQNAQLTALGCLGYLLTHSEITIPERKIGIVGYGRIGSRLLRLLLMLGCSVKVYTTRASVADELCRMGIGAVIMDGAEDYSGIDLLINTAPARLIDQSRLAEQVRIIELASGDNFDGDSRLVRLPSIPERMYPISAGRVYADAVIRHLEAKG